MIYKVTQEDIRKDNPSIDAIAAFAVCSSRELKFVFLTYDYDTPFKQLSFEERQDKSAREAGYHTEKDRMQADGQYRLDKTGRKAIDGKFPKIEGAIVAFKELRRDIDRETLESYDAQLEEINERLRNKKETDKDWDIAIKLVDKLPKLIKQRRDIIDLLDLRADFKEEIVAKVEAEEEAIENEPMTALERRNIKKYGV